MTDEFIAKTILDRGMAVGKPDVMPASPDLEQKPQVISELVKLLRSFGQDSTP